MRYEDVLKGCGIKVTKARISILELLEKEEFGLGAEDILKKLSEKEKGFDLSTIYRNLEKFCEIELMDKLNLGENKYLYKINKDKHKHILKCIDCNREIEIDCPLTQVKEYVKSRTGFEIAEHDFVLSGVCSECKRKEKGELWEK